MSGDLLARLIAAGTSADLVAEVARLEARAAIAAEELQAREAAEAARREKVRDGNAKRQRTRRARNGSSRDVTPVTRDTALPNVTPPSDKKCPPDPPKELTSPISPDEASASSPPAGAGPGVGEPRSENRQQRRAAARRGSRIPDDWAPPAIADLPQTIQAIVHGWPEGAYELTAEQFRNHWLAEGRGIGAKRDWPRTWHNWLIREAPVILRGAKAGMRFGSAAPVQGDWSPERMKAYVAGLGAG